MTHIFFIIYGCINVSEKDGAQIHLRIGAAALVFSLAVTGCSDSKNNANPSYDGKPNFFESGTELELAINDGCLTYKFAAGYFNLMVEKQASENETYFMAAEMEKAQSYFQTAIEIDEAEGGYQYKRFINYRDLAAQIANSPNRGLNWSFAAEAAHKDILKWCSDWSVQIDDKYDGMNSWSPEVSALKDSQRKP